MVLDSYNHNRYYNGMNNNRPDRRYDGFLTDLIRLRADALQLFGSRHVVSRNLHFVYLEVIQERWALAEPGSSTREDT